MPVHVSRGCYTADAVRGMMAAPEDREPSIAGVFEKLGGSLLCYYVTLGEFDWLLIAEFPNERAASSGVLVAMAGGSVSNVQTTVAMTSKQAMEPFSEAAAVAKSFKSAGKVIGPRARVARCSHQPANGFEGRARAMGYLRSFVWPVLRAA